MLTEEELKKIIESKPKKFYVKVESLAKHPRVDGNIKQYDIINNSIKYYKDVQNSYVSIYHYAFDGGKLINYGSYLKVADYGTKWAFYRKDLKQIPVYSAIIDNVSHRQILLFEQKDVIKDAVKNHFEKHRIIHVNSSTELEEVLHWVKDHNYILKCYNNDLEITYEHAKILLPN